MLQPMRIGHVVLKVRDLDRSLAFYRDLLGFRVASEMSNVMIFLTATGENHHDLALLRVGDSAPSPLPTAVGLYHVAMQLADWNAVKHAHEVLTERGLLKGIGRPRREPQPLHRRPRRQRDRAVLRRSRARSGRAASTRQ